MIEEKAPNDKCETLIFEVHSERVSYDFLASTFYAGLSPISEVIGVASKLVYQFGVQEPKLIRLANALMDDRLELEIELNFVGKIAIENDPKVLGDVLALWAAIHLSKKKTLRLGRVALDMTDDFAEISHYDINWEFPIAVSAGLGAIGKNKNQQNESEARQFRELFERLFERPEVVEALMDKFYWLSNLWR